jgi:hypothetical protein
MGKGTKILEEKKVCEMDKLLKKKLTTNMEQNFEYTSTMICYVWNIVHEWNISQVIAHMGEMNYMDGFW